MRDIAEAAYYVPRIHFNINSCYPCQFSLYILNKMMKLSFFKENITRRSQVSSFREKTWQYPQARHSISIKHAVEVSELRKWLREVSSTDISVTNGV